MEKSKPKENKYDRCLFFLIILKIPRFILKKNQNLVNFLINYYHIKSGNINIISYRIKGRFHIYNQGTIKIGSNFKCNSGVKYNPIGGDTISRLICHHNAILKIGDNVGMSNSTIFSTQEIIIDDCVLIGGGCKIWDTNFHSLDYLIRGTPEDKKKAITRAVHIKRNAFIGASSIILKGVVIGENSIIAAGSVVTKSVPDNQIWGGNPAKYIKDI